MFSLDELDELAQELRKRGIDVVHDFLYGPHGCIEGLDVGDDFFPRWELSIPENFEALEKADFAGIKQRRGPDWSIEPPVAKVQHRTA